MRQITCIVSLAISFLVGCSGQQPTPPPKQNAAPPPVVAPPAAPVPAPTPAAPTPTPVQIPRAEVIRFFLTGADAPGPFPSFIKAFFERDGEKARNQVFYHPQNRAEFGNVGARSYLNADYSVNHEMADFEDIARAIGESIKQQKPKRAIWFFEGHGAFGGNFCYQSQHLCTGTPAIFFAMLKIIDAKNRELSADRRMEHLLLLPLSCFNMPLSQDLFRLIATKSDWSFHVSDLHMIEHKANTTGSCSANIFAGNMYFEGHLDDRNFKSWAMTGDTMDLLTHLNSLEKFVEVRNRIERLPRVSNPLIFETARAANAPSVILKDFQLPVRLIVRQSNGAQPRFALTEHPLPAGLTTGELLDRYVPTQLQTRVVRLGLMDPAGQRQRIDILDRTHKPDYNPIQTVEFDLDLTR